MAVYTTDNPNYGEMTVEDQVTPNYLRCLAYNMWHGGLLQLSKDSDIVLIHQQLGLQQPSQSVAVALRDHARQFLDTVIPLAPAVITDSLLDEAIEFMLAAFPDVLIDVAIDVIAASARRPTTEEQLYEQFYAALEEIGVEYEPVSALYEGIEPDQMGGYIETNINPVYNMGGGDDSEPMYNMASGTMENPYSYAAGGGHGHEGIYSMADGGGRRHSLDDDEPVYSPANEAEPTYSFAGATDKEPTYSFAGAGSGEEPTYSFASGVDSEPTYSLAASKSESEPTYALGASKTDSEPTYALAGDLGEADVDAEPVYDMDTTFGGDENA